MSNHKLMDKYNPKEFEEKLYEQWEKNGYFKPSMDKTKESYCIMMPPPNVTGKLHMGHALDGTIQDILIRYKEGFGTLAMDFRIDVDMKEEDMKRLSDLLTQMNDIIIPKINEQYKK